jgi:NAD(P)-dependent dehydrogenase (short-subunit alcohol dehydrogenase family)
MRRLQGQVALVTGGGSGLGRAIVRRFLAEGARVGVLERVAARATELEREFGRESLVVTSGDVRNLVDNKKALGAILDRFGRLDVFVGNAGIYDKRAALRELPLEQTEAAFDELFAVNVKGYVLGARVAVDELRRTRGCILLTASVSGAMAGFGGALYIAAKHAVIGLTRQLAFELAPEVRVNAVAPGYIPTDLQGLETLGQGKALSNHAADIFPLQSIPEPDDYAAFYAHLASPEAKTVATGTILHIDGGLSTFGAGYKPRA